jgi:Zn-dependent protease
MTDEELQRRLLAGRTADGRQPEPAPPTTPTLGVTEAPPNPYYAAPPPYVYAKPPSLLERWKTKGGLVGALASALLLLAKIGAPVLALLAKLKFLLVALKLLTFGKFLLGGGSMLLSMWAWGLVYGWPLGVGIVLLIFIHECGHALAARRLGIPTGIMVFIPLMGAFVTTKRGAKNIVEDAFIGIMGPVFGTLAGVGCLVIYALTPSHSPFWLVLAQLNFFMNLFNLAPTPPLDGGWITPLFSPKLLAIGAVLLLFLVPLNPIIGLLALMSLPRIVSGWKAKPEESDFYKATAADRWRYGAAYLGLAAFLAAMGFGVHSHLITLPHPVA